MAALTPVHADYKGPMKSAGILVGSTSQTTSTTNTINLYGISQSRYLDIVIVTGAASATAALVVTVSGVSETGATWTLLASASIQSATTTVLRIGPGLPATANVSANDILPNVVQVQMAGTTSSGTLTYNIDYATS